MSLFSRASRWVGSLVFAFAIAGLPLFVHAQDGGFAGRVLEGATKAGSPAGLTETPPLEVTIGNVIGAVLGLLGVVLLCMMLYAGFLWMTAGGDEDKVKTARTMILNGVIGLVIIASAYAIVQFVINQFVGAVTGEQG